MPYNYRNLFFSETSKCFSTARSQIIHSDFDTVKFMDSVSRVRFLLLSERYEVKSATEFSRVLARGEALYFACLSAYGYYIYDKEKYPFDVYNESCKTAENGFYLFDKVRTCSDREIYHAKKQILEAETDRSIFMSRSRRFSALSKKGSITLALDEIEYISRCTRICILTQRMLSSFDALIPLCQNLTLYT